MAYNLDLPRTQDAIFRNHQDDFAFFKAQESQAKPLFATDIRGWRANRSNL